MNTVTLISSNVFGEGQDIRKVIPRFIHKALQDEPLEIEGGEQTRDFYHVENLVRLITQIIDRTDISGELFNVGGEYEIKISELARKIIQNTNSNSIITVKPYRFDDTQNSRLTLQTRKTKRILSYRLIVPFQQGLQRTIGFMRRQKNTQQYEGLCAEHQ